MKMPFQTASFYGKLKDEIWAESIFRYDSIAWQFYMVGEDKGRLKYMMRGV